MASIQKTLRVAMPAWELGRANTGLGVKIGGLGVIIEELPSELVKAAAKQGLNLEIEILTPCFAHYDKNQLSDTGLRMPVMLDGQQFEFQVYKFTFPDGQTVVYFWDEWQLSWTNPSAIYPDDPEMAFKLFAVTAQAMAGYIRQHNFHTIHSHDYHVGLIPFYLGDAYLAQVPHHFTIHNATYQGRYPVYGRGYEALARINLSGPALFHKYFDHFDYLNLMKAVMLKTHETGGKITTVSGDVTGSWGYAAELREDASTLLARAERLKGGAVREVFLPNQYLDLFEKLPIMGITNGLSKRNWPENLPELKSNVLQELQQKQGEDTPIFKHPRVQETMLSKDHNFDLTRLHVKAQLKALLHLETFGTDLSGSPILITAVGRLVAQKNLGLITDIIEPTLAYDAGAKFIILASAPDGDFEGKSTEAAFFRLATLYPQRVYFNNTFNLPLSKLIFSGGDFTLIPSRFEPCGLVDYEASLLGNLVIGRLTGGLAKVQHCAYLYEWLDISDRFGEAKALFQQIQAAINVYRREPAHHEYRIQQAMSLDATWDTSAAQYIKLYRYGLLMKTWRQQRKEIIVNYLASLSDDEPLLREFFIPGSLEYSDHLDWALYERLQMNS